MTYDTRINEVLTMLMQGSISTNDVRRELSVSRPTAMRRLKALQANGLCRWVLPSTRNSREGRWVLAVTVPQARAVLGTKVAKLEADYIKAMKARAKAEAAAALEEDQIVRRHVAAIDVPRARTTARRSVFDNL